MSVVQISVIVASILTGEWKWCLERARRKEVIDVLLVVVTYCDGAPGTQRRGGDDTFLR